MANGTPITVCVVALSHGQHTAVAPPDLKAEVLGASATYDIATKGKVYGGSPDDWCPFGDGMSVWQHLQNAGFDPNSLSSRLADAAQTYQWPALMKAVDLYIFDPLFLAYEKRPEGLIDKLDGVIGGQGSKAFCVVLPERLPPPLRARLDGLCTAKLQLSASAYEDDGRGRWGVREAKDFKAYLKALLGQKQGLPIQGQVDQVQRLLMQMGAQLIQMPQPPRLGLRANP